MYCDFFFEDFGTELLTDGHTVSSSVVWGKESDKQQ